MQGSFRPAPTEKQSRAGRFAGIKRLTARGKRHPRPPPAANGHETRLAIRAAAHVLIENAFCRRIVPSVEVTPNPLSFEAALTQLESVVEAMESGEVPLAELLAKFEEGNKLLKVCEARLKEAELKIELLKKQKDGVAFTAFETSSDT